MNELTDELEMMFNGIVNVKVWRCKMHILQNFLRRKELKGSLISVFVLYDGLVLKWALNLHPNPD